MSTSSSSTGWTLGALFFWGFIVTKVIGHTFALWSWWWILLPVVPVLGEVVHHFNL